MKVDWDVFFENALACFLIGLFIGIGACIAVVICVTIWRIFN